jgi:hypothetical protein
MSYHVWGKCGVCCCHAETPHYPAHVRHDSGSPQQLARTMGDIPMVSPASSTANSNFSPDGLRVSATGRLRTRRRRLSSANLHSSRRSTLPPVQDGRATTASATPAACLVSTSQESVTRTVLLVFVLPITSLPSRPVAPLPQHGTVASGTFADTRWAQSTATRVSTFSSAQSLVLLVATPRVDVTGRVSLPTHTCPVLQWLTLFAVSKMLVLLLAPSISS